MITFAEPPFERVWAAVVPGRPTMILGLQFEGRTIEGELHSSRYARRVRGVLLEDLAEIVMDEQLHHQAAMTGPRA